GIFSTSEAEFTISPTDWPSTSATRMRVFRPVSGSASRKRLRRSTTGTILPRRLMTPSMNSAALGTAVISGTRTISRTMPMGTPKVSRPTRKPTRCSSFSMAALRHSGIDQFGQPRLVLAAPAVARLAAGQEVFGSSRVVLRALVLLFEGDVLQRLEQSARQFGHLFGGGRQLGRAGGRVLHQLAHLLHRAHHRLCPGGLLLDGGADLLGDLVQPVGGLGDLRRTHGLF